MRQELFERRDSTGTRRTAARAMGLAMTLLCCLSAPIHLQAQARPGAFVSAAATPVADDLGAGLVASAGACIARCERSLSLYAFSSISARGPGRPQRSTNGMQTFTELRAETSLGAGVMAQWHAVQLGRNWSIDLQGGVLLSRNRIQRDLFTSNGPGTDALLQRSNWRNDYGPTLGLQLRRQLGGRSLLFGARAELSDQWRFPIGVGIAF